MRIDESVYLKNKNLIETVLEMFCIELWERARKEVESAGQKHDSELHRLGQAVIGNKEKEIEEFKEKVKIANAKLEVYDRISRSGDILPGNVGIAFMLFKELVTKED